MVRGPWYGAHDTRARVRGHGTELGTEPWYGAHDTRTMVRGPWYGAMVRGLVRAMVRSPLQLEM